MVNGELSIIQLSIINLFNYSAFLPNNNFYEATFLVGW